MTGDERREEDRPSESLLEQDRISKGLFVAVGLAYLAIGPPLFGLEPGFIGGALAGYGIVSFVGKRLVARWGVLGR